MSKSFKFNLYKEIYQNIEAKTIGEKLRKRRLLLGLSQEEFSKKVDLTRNAINNYELGITLPSKEALLKLIKIIDKDYLCDDEYYQFVLSDYSSAIKKWRENNDLSLRQAAKILGVSPSALGSWENQVYTIDRRSYEKIKNQINHKLLHQKDNH